MGLNTTPRTWVAGEIITDTEMNTEIRDAFTGIQAVWTTYTPTISGYTSITPANLTGRYMQVGKTVHWHASWAVTSINLGSSTITVALPLAVASSYPSGIYAQAVGNLVYRTSAGAYVTGVAEAAAGATATNMMAPVPGSTSPQLARVTGAYGSQTSNDSWVLWGTYEAA
jgi:hypothetical protein